jgi:hypothetical protein
MSALQLPAPTASDPVDSDLEQMARDLMAGKRYAAAQYLGLLRELRAKAKKGDRNAAELILKFGVAPAEEMVEQHKADAPSGPTPVATRFAFYSIRQNVFGSSAEPVKLSQAEYDALPATRPPAGFGVSKADIEGKFEIVTADAMLAPANGGEATDHSLPVASPPPLPANHTCIDCQTPFYNRQPHAKRCHACGEADDKRRLAASKARRGLHLSPAFAAHHRAAQSLKDGEDNDVTA